ncbi:phosphoribosyltransferase domain-containing protein, partial [Sandarakinorhabdus sp.]|uniref:phosphoribosyltransferase domain-containing protein n=1 Tax=Sandarakinorhabdus sp. TaxID=1916663 RepID=UPI00334081A0
MTTTAGPLPSRIDSPNGEQPAPDASGVHRCALAAGTVTVQVLESGAPDPNPLRIDDLCSFAARNNPRRGFLVVSKVLGRHLPTTPAAIRDSARRLIDALLRRHSAAGISDLPGPVVFFGMAETAVCLAHSCYADYAARTGRQDLLFIHSTRQWPSATGQAIIAEFAEPHSHAAAHMVLSPVTAAGRTLLAQARTLVVIDDESSTGTTFVNAIAALRPCMPRLERVATAVLTDWSGGHDWQQQLPLPHIGASLLQGTLHWTPDPGFVSPANPITRTGAFGTLAATGNHGRGGIHPGDDPLLDSGRFTAAARAIIAARDRPHYVVLGTGEFTYPALLIAEQLAALGRDVHIQAITRSPIHIGGAITSKLEL